MPFFWSVMPEALRTSLWAMTGYEKGTERREHCASGIINMDGTLTLLVQLICVSILLAAVQTCPGFTVQWLLLIVNVTQLQRRASTVDWSSLSLTSWLTSANAPQLSKHDTSTHSLWNHSHPCLKHKPHGTFCVRQFGEREVLWVHWCRLLETRNLGGAGLGISTELGNLSGFKWQFVLKHYNSTMKWVSKGHITNPKLIFLIFTLSNDLLWSNFSKKPLKVQKYLFYCYCTR